MDRCSLCSSETDLESSGCVCNSCAELSQDLLERSAQKHSLLKAPAAPADEGTVRRMARSMVQCCSSR